MFGGGITDLLSGYRVFSRRFVKSFPALSSGFETETEFTVHALALHMPVQEVRGALPQPGRRDRVQAEHVQGRHAHPAGDPDADPAGTAAAGVFRSPRWSAGAVGIGLGVPVVLEFLQTGLVPRLPTALLATGLMLLAFLSLTCGLILDAVSRGRKENKRLAYLAIPPPEPLR